MGETFNPGDVVDLGGGVYWRLDRRMALSLNRMRRPRGYFPSPSLLPPLAQKSVGGDHG